MQLFYQRFNTQEYLLFTILGLTSLVLLANFIDPKIANDTVNGLSIILSSIVMLLAIGLVSKYGLKGNHGKAWILFMLFSAYWFCAESVNLVYEQIFGIEVWQYADDFFYITGYQLFFASLLFYLKPFSKQISNKLVFGVSIISISLLIPSTMLVIQNSELIDENLVLLQFYNIFDSLVLVPALIGVFLFFRGGVNFMFSLLCLGVICQIIADNSILFLTLENFYYSGHLIEALFLWAYTVFAFGLGNQIRLFDEKPKKTDGTIFGKPYSRQI